MARRKKVQGPVLVVTDFIDYEATGGKVPLVFKVDPRQLVRQLKRELNDARFPIRLDQASLEVEISGPPDLLFQEVYPLVQRLAASLGLRLYVAHPRF